jgi:type IV pilus assembly protein PilB
VALNAILDAQDQLVRLGGWLRITNASNLIKQIFRITRFADWVAIIDDEGVIGELNTDFGSGMRLGDILVQRGIIDAAQLSQAIEKQESSQKRLGQILIEDELAKEHDVYEALGQQLQMPFVRLKMGLFDEEQVRNVDRHVVERLGMLPLFEVRGVLSVATANPQDMPAIAELEERLGLKVSPVLTPPGELGKTIADAYNDSGFADEIVVDLEEGFEVVESNRDGDYDAIDEMAAGSPVINLVNSVIQRAVRDGASDIHIEPGRQRSLIRYRIDGVLYEALAPSSEMHPAIVSRLKVMANLDIAERRLPQDGRIQVQTQGRHVDLRFSSLPGLYGEKIVLRVLDKDKSILDIGALGMSSGNVDQFRSLMTRSYGLLLVTGPTGSGKTTSLYAALNYLNSIEKNIVTIEDPVEYQLDVINQNEVKNKIGLGFAKMLKAVLRQDPDIVMVGEIRERETAEIAVQAALTGHLVLSTLHTNDSIGAITRLIDMGVEPYLLSSALLGVVAQRLVRTICPHCKTRFIAPPDVVEQYGLKDPRVQLAKGRGCSECYDSGYMGRAGIHEVLEITPELQRLVMSNPSRDELNNYIASQQMATLMDAGVQRVLAQETTLEEVSRVINV